MRRTKARFAAAFLSFALCLSLVPSAAFAQDDSANEEIAAASGGAGAALTTDIAEPLVQGESTDTQVPRTARSNVSFVYVESPEIDLSENQNIVIGFSDEGPSFSQAELTVRSEAGDDFVVGASGAVDGAVLFTIAAAEQGAGEFEIMRFSYTENETGRRVHEDLIQASGDYYSYRVVEGVSTLFSGESPEGVSVYTITEDGSMEQAADLQDAIGAAQSGQSPAGSISSFSLSVGDASPRSSEVVVALDPGHGGSDSGAVANELVEKSLNLKIAQYCKDELEKYAGVRVVMTRSGDEYVGLVDRVRYAVQQGATVFVSIHCNSGGGSGSEVFIPNSSSYQYQTHVTGEELAAKILQQITALGLVNRGIKVRDSEYYQGEGPFYYEDGHLADYYTVINESRENGIPGIIVEHAFLDNASDAAFLSNEANLMSLGVADAAGIVQQYGLTIASRESVEAYVKRLYSNVLGREPDAGGFETQVNAMLKGQLTAATAALSFFCSSEFPQRGLSDEEVVEIAYRTMLDRGSDPAGKANWVDMLAAGMSPGIVVSGFSASDEFRALCAKWGVSAGSVSLSEPRDQSYAVTSFVHRLYSLVLGREPDEGGLNAQCAFLLAGGTAASLVQNFFCSSEFPQRGLSDEEVVEIAYRTMLDRGSDPAGKANWVDKMETGMPVHLLLAGFCGSDEFKAICSRHSIVPGILPYDISEIAKYGGHKIMGPSSESMVDKMVSYFQHAGASYPDSAYRDKGAKDIRAFCQLVHEESSAEGVRCEVLFCQAMKETGWLQFGGSVKADQCNFGGLGATGAAVGGATFPDVRTGLRAQVQHLKLYASTDPLVYDVVDPRWDAAVSAWGRGCAPNLEDLNGKWAVPGDGYGESLFQMIQKLKTC